MTKKTIPRPPHEDTELLQSRAIPGDFTTMDPWRVLRIQGEIVEGFEAQLSTPAIDVGCHAAP